MVAINNGYRMPITQHPQPVRESKLTKEIDRLGKENASLQAKLDAERDKRRRAEASAMALQEIVGKATRPVAAPPEVVLGIVTSLFGVSEIAVTGPSKLAGFVRPRQMAMLLMRRYSPECHNSLGNIGRYFNGRDHTTVIAALNEARRRIKNDKNYAAKYTRAESLLGGGDG